MPLGKIYKVLKSSIAAFTCALTVKHQKDFHFDSYHIKNVVNAWLVYNDIALLLLWILLLLVYFFIVTGWCYCLIIALLII